MTHNEFAQLRSVVSMLALSLCFGVLGCAAGRPVSSDGGVEDTDALMPTEIDGIQAYADRLPLADATKLRLHGSALLSPDACTTLSHMHKLRDVGMTHVHITAPLLTSLKGLPHLTVVRIHSQQIDEGALAVLREFDSLKELDLSGSNIDDASVQYLPDVDTLNLRETNLTDAGLRHLAGAKRLRELNLMCCGPITGTGLAVLKNCPIEVLYLLGTSADVGVENLAELRRLRELRGPLPATETALAALSKLGELRVLELDADTTIGSSGLTPLMKLTKLRELRIFKLGNADERIAVLSEMKSLRMLSLASAELTDRGLSHISRMRSLEMLDITRTDVTDDGLSLLPNLRGLKELSLEAVQGITDRGMLKLVRLPELEELDLQATRISDASIAVLGQFQHLRRLNVCGTPMTEQGISELRRNLPNAYVMPSPSPHRASPEHGSR
jgi:Leucine-rich repeat (LRR) protein